MRWARLTAVASALASVPLFLTYQIKHTLFPRSYFFVFMYSAGLISVLLVPSLLALETILIVVSTKRGQHDVRRWHISGALVAILAEGVFLLARNL